MTVPQLLQSDISHLHSSGNMAAANASPNTYALIIGIDFYPNIGRDYSTSLGGCIGDAKLFQRRIEEHLQRRGIPQEKWSQYMTVLTATIKTPKSPKNYQPVEQGDNLPLPNAETIIEAMYNLGDKAKKGDIVFISYSGHGGREKTVVGDWAGKSSDLDETLCPFDYCKGGLSVRDFVMNYLFKRIVATGAHLTVFLDSCHSGGATRSAKPDQPLDYDEPEITIRSMPASDGKEVEIEAEDYWNVRGPLREKQAEIRADWEELMQRTSQSPAGSGVLLRPLGYSLFTGCLAHEYSGENYGGGFLSTGTLDALATAHYAPNPDTVSLKHIYRHIFDMVYRRRTEPLTERIFLQSPLLLGSVDRPFPGNVQDELPQQPADTNTMAIYLRVQPSSSTTETEFPILYLRAGAAHGAVVGAEYGVYRWFDNPGDPPEVRVVITEVRKTVSVITLSGSQTGIPKAWEDLGREQQALQNARRVKTINRSTLKPYTPLRKSYPWPTGCVATLISGPPSAAKRIKILGDVAGLSKDVYVPGEIPLTFLPADSGEAEDFRIFPSSNTYELQDAKGTALLPPTTSIAACLHNAAHIARYDRLLAINGTDFAECFELTKREPTPNETATGDPSSHSYVTFSWIPSEADTPNKRFVNVSIFHFTPAPEYAIRRVYPIDSGFESVDPADFRDFSIPATTGTLKAMVFWASTDLEWWQMGPAETAHVGELITKSTPLEEVKQAIPPSPKAQDPKFVDVEEIDGLFDLWCTKELTLG